MCLKRCVLTGLFEGNRERKRSKRATTNMEQQRVQETVNCVSPRNNHYVLTDIAASYRNGVVSIFCPLMYLFPTSGSLGFGSVLMPSNMDMDYTFDVQVRLITNIL